MSRLIGPSTGTERNQHRRSIAEALRRLMGKQSVDAEAKDLIALVVFSLRAIAEGIERSAAAWEKRDYFVKADRFRADWAWVETSANRLEVMLRGEMWNDLPLALVELVPRFADITITKFVRTEALWRGCYQRLMAEK